MSLDALQAGVDPAFDQVCHMSNKNNTTNLHNFLSQLLLTLAAAAGADMHATWVAYEEWRRGMADLDALSVDLNFNLILH